MADFAIFTGPGGSDPVASIRAEIEALTQITTGDLLFAGQIFRARIRERTAAGIDVNGSPFAPYSTNGPYYLYPNRETARGKLRKNRKVRMAAAKARHENTGGRRTSLGIRYESYAAAKAAHGDSTVNEYGMEQHTHMLDTIIVGAGGFQIDQAESEDAQSLPAFDITVPASELRIGFYGREAERAQGQNEGNSKTPRRYFFGVNQEDLDLAARAIGERMRIRAAALAKSR